MFDIEINIVHLHVKHRKYLESSDLRSSHLTLQFVVIKGDKNSGQPNLNSQNSLPLLFGKGIFDTVVSTRDT